MLSRIEANLNSFKPAINELPERRASVLIRTEARRSGSSLMAGLKEFKFASILESMTRESGFFRYFGS